MGNRAIEQQPVLENIEQQAVEVVQTELEKKDLDVNKMSENQLLDVMTRATDELVRRSLDKNPADVLWKHLLTVSNGNNQALLEYLKRTGEQLGVEKRVIRDAVVDQPSSITRLFKKTAALFSSAISLAREQITFSNVFNLGMVYRFGLTPYLIRGAALRSGLSILGFAHGMVAFGLTSRFLYMHPDILKWLTKLQGASSMEFLDNIDLYVILTALKSAVTSEFSYFLKDGIRFTHVRSDLSVFGPFLRTSLDYIGWSASVIEFAVNYGIQDISQAFAYWVETKTGIFGYVRDATSYIQKKAADVAEAVSEMKKKATQAVEDAGGKVYKFIVDEKSRKEAVAYGLEKLQSIQDWWYGKATDATLAMKETAKELDIITEKERRMEDGYEPGDMSRDFGDDLYELAAESPLRLSGRRKKYLFD